ncbi:MAG: hypothetical protein ACYC0B_02005 [Gemmatimonadaceae bacterium]
MSKRLQEFYAHVDANRYVDALMVAPFGYTASAPRTEPGSWRFVVERDQHYPRVEGTGKDAMQALRNATTRLKHELRQTSGAPPT